MTSLDSMQTRMQEVDAVLFSIGLAQAIRSFVFDALCLNARMMSGDLAKDSALPEFAKAEESLARHIQDLLKPAKNAASRNEVAAAK